MQLHLSNKYVIDKNIIYNDYCTPSSTHGVSVMVTDMSWKLPKKQTNSFTLFT